MLPGSVFLCPRPVPGLLGWALPRAAWVKLNRLWTGVEQFHSSMHKWGLAPSPNCECDASEQTADHVLTACPIHRASHGARGLTVLDDETRSWLNNTTASIWFSSTAVWGSKRINPRPQSCLCLAWSGCPSNDDDDDPISYFKQKYRYWKLIVNEDLFL